MNSMRLASLLACLLVLSGCSTISEMFGGPKRTALRELNVSADIAANGGNATMLDVVFIYDQAIAAQLPKTGPLWFQQKNALQKSLATGIDVVALQVPAGAPSFAVALPKDSSRAVGVYVLANYIAEDGQVIAAITPWKRVSIRLLPKTIAYSSN